MDRSKYKHTTQIRVRSYEVDWQNIVHNASYLQYFEVGRVEYLKHVGLNVDVNSIQNESRVVLVRNEINYKSPARFDELLNVFTRVMYIHTTSFAFEGLIEEASTGRPIADNIAVHVWLHPRTGEPIPVNEHFKRIIQQFEGMDVAILWKPEDT